MSGPPPPPRRRKVPGANVNISSNSSNKNAISSKQGQDGLQKSSSVSSLESMNPEGSINQDEQRRQSEEKYASVPSDEDPASPITYQSAGSGYNVSANLFSQ